MEIDVTDERVNIIKAQPTFAANLRENDARSSKLTDELRIWFTSLSRKSLSISRLGFPKCPNEVDILGKMSNCPRQRRFYPQGKTSKRANCDDKSVHNKLIFTITAVCAKFAHDNHFSPFQQRFLLL